MLSDLKQATKIIADLVAFDTTPEQPTAPLLDYVEAAFKAYNLTYRRQALHDGRHGVMLARIGADAPGGCLLSGHMDVVSVEGQDWKTDPFKLHDDGDRLYGRGACDMKGFIGCVLAMIPTWLNAKLDKPIYIGLTCDEETTVESIDELIKLVGTNNNKPVVSILGEPTDMQIIGCHKGAQEFCVDITGVASHASRPDLGTNAINIASRVITFTEELQDKLRQDTVNPLLNPPYATTSVGLISGGNAINTVAERCCVKWNVRQVSNNQLTGTTHALGNFINGELRTEFPNATIVFREHAMPALELICDNPAVQVAQAILGQNEIKAAPFATEAGYYQLAGISSVVVGPGSIEQAHRPDEYVEIKQIEFCLDFLKALVDPKIQELF